MQEKECPDELALPTAIDNAFASFLTDVRSSEYGRHAPSINQPTIPRGVERQAILFWAVTSLACKQPAEPQVCRAVQSLVAQAELLLPRRPLATCLQHIQQVILACLIAAWVQTLLHLLMVRQHSRVLLRQYLAMHAFD